MHGLIVTLISSIEWVVGYEIIIGCNISNPATVNDENKFHFSFLRIERRLFGFRVI
jgi:hypothetical protein